MTTANFHLQAWAAWTPHDGAISNHTEKLPASLRRRVTPLGRQALSDAWDMPEIKNARLIFSSRYGEFSRTVSLMEAVTQRTELSPADFTLSVHHALIGLLSIAIDNHKGHIAIAAGSESFCFALIEAIACLNEKPEESVVLIHCDEPLSGPFSIFSEPNDEPITLALALGKSVGEMFTVERNAISKGDVTSQSHAINFLNFIKNSSSSSISSDQNNIWKWIRHGLA